MSLCHDRTHPPSTMMSSLFLGGRCWLSWAICCCVAPSPWTNQLSVSRPADQSQPSITCTPSAQSTQSQSSPYSSYWWSYWDSWYRLLQSFKLRSTRRFVITEKTPTRAFSWLEALFKTLLRLYAKGTLTPRKVDVKSGSRHNYHKGWEAIRHFSSQLACPL